MALDVITSISLDMQNPYSTTDMVHVNQYDSGLRVKATLLNAGQKWEVPLGAKAVVAFKKSDNIGGFYDATDDDPSVQAVSVDNNRSIIYISLDAQTTTTPTAANQYVDMQVVFYENGKRLSTFAFYMDVRPSIVASKDITSNWVFHILAEEIASTLTVATTPDAMREWLETNIHPYQGYPIDDTLTVPGAASDAAATGKMVTVSDQNPNTVANKVWVKKTPYEVQVPTMDDIANLDLNSISISPVTTRFLNYEYSDLMSLASPGAANKRSIKLNKNRIHQEPVINPANGSTFYSFLISKSPKYLGGSDTAIKNALTADDFISLDYLDDRQYLYLKLDFSSAITVETTAANVASSAILIATYNPDSQYISLAMFGGGNFGSAGNRNEYVNRSYFRNIYEQLPEIQANKNIAIIYQSRYPSVTEDFEINLLATMDHLAYETPMTVVNNQSTANEYYSKGTLLLNKGVLYKTTQEVLTGENLVAGENLERTTFGNEIESNSNYINSLSIDGSMWTHPFSDIKQGSIGATNGVNLNKTNRCRSSIYFTFYSPFDEYEIAIKDGYKVYIIYYAAEDISSFEKSDGWISGNTSLHGLNGHYIRFVIAFDDDRDITPSDILENYITITPKEITDKTLSLSDKFADSKATGDALSSIKKNLGYSDTLSFSWAHVTITNETGASSGGYRTDRYCTSDISLDDYAGKNVVVKVANGWQFVVHVFDESYIHVFNTDWETEPYTLEIKKGFTYRFLLSNIDSSIDISALNPNNYFTIEYGGGYQHSIVELNDPNVMEEKLAQLARPVRTASRALGTKPLVFLHFSDIHGDEEQLKRIVSFKKYYNTYIQDILHTGDTVFAQFTYGMEFWNNVSGSEYILNTIGNHDTYISGVSWIAKTMKESYDAYMKPYIANWNVSYTPDKTYYYKDYSNSKVRLIVLDIMHQEIDQLQWFKNVLASALTSNLDVIVAAHSRASWKYVPLNTNWDDAIHIPSYKDDTYTDTSASDYPQNLADEYAIAVDEFIDNGGYFIAWLHGHTHFKMFAHLADHQRQLNIAVSNASTPAFAWTYVWARIVGTKSEDDFNVVGIDTDSKVIRIVKVGVDYDRYMRHIDTICYDYANHILITD